MMPANVQPRQFPREIRLAQLQVPSDRDTPPHGGFWKAKIFANEGQQGSTLSQVVWVAEILALLTKSVSLWAPFVPVFQSSYDHGSLNASNEPFILFQR